MALDQKALRDIWQKGYITEEADPEIWRKDECGAWIRWGAYGDVESQFGWDVDPTVPGSDCGGENPSNLRPLQWRNRAAKQGGRLMCPITASGKYNVRR